MPAGTPPASHQKLAAATILPHTDEPLLVLGVADPATFRRLGIGCQHWHEQHAWWPLNPRMIITRDGDQYTLQRQQRDRTADVAALTTRDPQWAQADTCLVGIMTVSSDETIQSMLTRFPDACMAGQVYMCEVAITAP